MNYEHHVRIGILCLICVLYSTIWSRDHSEELTDARYEVPFSMKTVLLVSQLSVSTLPLSLPFFKLRLQTGRFPRRSKCAVELHRDDGAPSEERDEEGGVVTLGAGAGRCPGPAAAEVANQDCSGRTALVKEPSACAMGGSSRTLLMAVCLRY